MTRVPTTSLGNGVLFPFFRSQSNSVPKTLLARRTVTTVLACLVASNNIGIENPATLVPFGSPLLLTTASHTSEWLDPSIVKWLHDNTIIYQNPFNELKKVIFRVFGSVDVITALYHDPDENWSKVTIDIASHFGDDFEAQFSKEDELFSEIGNCQTIRKILPHLIIRQI